MNLDRLSNLFDHSETRILPLQNEESTRSVRDIPKIKMKNICKNARLIKLRKKFAKIYDVLLVCSSRFINIFIYFSFYFYDQSIITCFRVYCEFFKTYVFFISVVSNWNELDTSKYFWNTLYIHNSFYICIILLKVIFYLASASLW